jgi:glycosyltransferase involved in cell wall biosynthesis
MKIAQVSPLFETVPPAGYGGTERVVSWLCDGLTALGHDVTLFASGGSRSSANLITYRDQPIRTDTGLCWDTADHAVMIDNVRRLAHEFDVIHFHTDILQMLYFREYADKTVTTLHGRLDFKGLPEFLQRFDAFPLVSVSRHQRLAAPSASYIDTIYHGLPLDAYEPNFGANQQYVAFLGRFSPEKGPDRAIDIALRAGVPIRIAAKICRQFRLNEDYYHEVVRPLLDLPGVEYVGEIGDREKNNFLGNAKAVLFPINWPEPFGLVMIEAMACGTPVIAYAAGSVPEIIDDGITGFIVRTPEEAVSALGKIDQLDRKAIREQFEKRFSSMTMSRAYTDLYERIVSASGMETAIDGRGWQPPSDVSSRVA